MSVEHSPEDTKSQVRSAFTRIIGIPFRQKYDDKWEEEAYWEAVKTFKDESQKIGCEDPSEILVECGFGSFENIRDKLKAGPKPCFRDGWVSPYTGAELDVLALVEKLHHGSGPKFEGKERVVILDFWATWCQGCIMIAPKLSDIYERYTGRVAVIGVVNDDMFNKGMDHNEEAIKESLKTHKESARYPTYIDVDNLARDSSFVKVELLGLPCAVLLVDNVVKFAGGVGFIHGRLEEMLKELRPIEE
ncbi:hypothetical protein EMPS_10576 [Entomortierella parvispora]|uniref:Thioredoxin domain-containing protein n=1 Tax=Entomortierella parvispora TaxID=205924 RepID=A0A9P3M1G6_9FUNG|nr:hypothetical protein EMPS_10576 [Entomortierella parvispora]